MAAGAEREGYDGLAQLSHAIRRSTALYVAMQITEPGSSVEQLLETMEVLAAGIRGKAEEPTRSTWRPPED